MSILSAWLGWDREDEMARSKKLSIDETKVDAWVARLKLASRNAAQFDLVFGELEGGEGLTTAEITAVAHKFAGGAKPKSKRAALLAIAQERQRVAHSKAKGASAAKTRVW